MRPKRALFLACLVATVATVATAQGPTLTVDPEVAVASLPIELEASGYFFFCPETTTVLEGDNVTLQVRMGCPCLLTSSYVSRVRTTIDPLPTGRYTFTLEILSDQPFCPENDSYSRTFYVATPLDIVTSRVVPETPSEDDDVVLEIDALCNSLLTYLLIDQQMNVSELVSVAGANVSPDCDPGLDPLETREIPLGRLPAGDHLVINRAATEAGVGIDHSLLFAVTPTDQPPVLVLDERFSIAGTWRRLDGRTGNAIGEPLAGSSQAGVLWFFRPENIEMMIKVLDGCAQNGHYWLFASGLTNVEVDLTVTDTVTGAERRVVNPLGRPFAPVLDTRAFTCN